MEELLRGLIDGSSGLGAYGIVFGILVACGLGVPLPEDISLLLGGYLAHSGSATLLGMMVTGFTGILVGDSLIYLAGRRVGSRVGSRQRGLISRVVTPEKRAKVEALFARHGEKIVMIARFLPGVRAVTYFTAGSARMRYWRFIVWDGVAALLSAPIFVWLGYRFGGELELVINALKKGQLWALGLVALVVVGAVLVRRFRRGRVAAAAQAARAELEPVHALAPVREDEPRAPKRGQASY